MSTWWYRTAGTVGVAGSFLLGAGAAHAADPQPAAPEPRAGVLGDLLGPTGGLVGDLTGNADQPGVLPAGDPLPGQAAQPAAPVAVTVHDLPRGSAADPAAAANDASRLAPSSVMSPLSPVTGGGLPLNGLNLGGLAGLLPGGGLGGGLLPNGQVPTPLGNRNAAQPELLGGGLPLLSDLGGLGGRLPTGGLPTSGLPLGGLPLGGTPVPGAATKPATQPATKPATRPATGHVAAPQAPKTRSDAPKSGRDRDFSDGRPVAGEDAAFR